MLTKHLGVKQMKTSQQDILLKEQRVDFFDEYGYIPENDELFDINEVFTWEVIENEL